MNPTSVPRFGLTARGVLTVAAHEFRLRIRAGRWRWLLGAWFVALLLFTATLRQALIQSGQGRPGTDMFGGLLIVMLGLALLVVPALTAQSINGDRARGVLASLQTTLLSPAEIALGKLMAAWSTACIFVIVSLPLALWCVMEGAAGQRVVVALLVATALLGTVCAIAQCLSAVLARTTTSAVMSYLAVFALTVGSVLAFGLALALTQTTETRETSDGRVEEITTTHPERVWWLLAPNPFVIVADAAPQVEPSTNGDSVRLDALGAIGSSVRALREPARVAEEGSGGAVWPYGLATNVAIGIGAVVLTARRLQAPSARLPKAVRVA